MMIRMIALSNVWVGSMPAQGLPFSTVIMGEDVDHFNQHGNYDHHDEVLHLKSPFPVAVSSNTMVVIGVDNIQGVFCDCHPPKRFKYGKPRLGESTST